MVVEITLICIPGSKMTLQWYPNTAAVVVFRHASWPLMVTILSAKKIQSGAINSESALPGVSNLG